jgi:thymidylate synthase (FAD)
MINPPKYEHPGVVDWWLPVYPDHDAPVFWLMQIARSTQGDHRRVIDAAFCGKVVPLPKTVRAVTETEATEFVERLVKKGHLGVLEHVSVSCRIVCSRVTSHQLVRHRIGMSYLQESGRHVGAHTFIRRMHDKETMAVKMAFSRAEATALREYERMIKAGTPKELARYVLPQTLATSVVVTGNLRAWRHFLELRLDKAAQDEIRYIATQIRDKLGAWCPPILYGLDKEKHANEA